MRYFPDRDSRRTSAKLTLVSALVFIAITSNAVATAPGRSPSQLLPSNGLCIYVEYDGLAAHSTAWKATAAYDILGKTSAGAMLSDVSRQLIDALSDIGSGRKLVSSEVIAIEEHLVDRGFAVAFYDDNGTTSRVILVRAAGKADAKKLDLIRRYVFMADEAKAISASTPLRGRAIVKFGNQYDSDPKVGKADANPPSPFDFPGLPTTDSAKLISAWVEGEDLIIVQGPDPDREGVIRGDGATEGDRAARHKAQVTAVLDAIDGVRPQIAAHPAFLAASAQGRDLGGFEANGLFLVEASQDRKGILSLLFSAAELAQPGERDIFETLGLDGARRIVGRWGFRGKALLTDFRFESSEPWKRAGAMFTPASLRPDRLPPIPAGSGAIAVGSFRRADLKEALAPLWPLIKADVRPILEAAEKAIAEMTAGDFRDEVLRHLGPTWCIFASTSARPSSGGDSDPAFLIEVADPVVTARLLDEAASRANQYFRRERPGDGPPALILDRLPAPERGYRLTSPAGAVPWLKDGLEPTILLGKKYIALAASRAVARAAIAGETDAASRFTPAGELAKSLGCLPGTLSFLMVGNPRDSLWPYAIANFPSKAGPFMSNFFGLPIGDLSAKPGSDLLGLLGVERGRTPTADEISAHLFPSVIAASVDDRSFRFIALEALPFSFLGPEIEYREVGHSKKVDINIKFRPGK